MISKKILDKNLLTIDHLNVLLFKKWSKSKLADYFLGNIQWCGIHFKPQ